MQTSPNHERVIASNPGWSVNDWCRYWELDARKIEKKYDIKWERLKDCGDGCRCKELK